MGNLMNFLFMLVCLLSFGGATLWAHEGLIHVIGTVTAIDAAKIEVKTHNSEIISLELRESTSYESRNAQSVSRPPRRGEGVMIHAWKDGEVLKAVSIIWFTPGSTPWAMH